MEGNSHAGKVVEKGRKKRVVDDDDVFAKSPTQVSCL